MDENPLRPSIMDKVVLGENKYKFPVAQLQHLQPQQRAPGQVKVPVAFLDDVMVDVLLTLIL